MNPPLKVETTLTKSQLEEFYRKAKTPLERQRAHVVLLRFENMPPSEVAHLLRLTPATVSRYVKRFNQLGSTSFIDARTLNAGRVPLLDDEGRAALLQMLQTEPPQGGRWSAPKVARWIEKRLGLPDNSLHRARGWEALQSVGYTYKSSRPRHAESASEQEREAWKKKSTRASRAAQTGQS